MSLKQVWSLIVVLFVFGGVFFLGYLFGNREYVNNLPSVLGIQGPNLSQPNSLSEMVIKDIYGSKDSKNIQVFGQLYYKVLDDQTEVLIKFNNAPTKIKQTQGNLTKEIPRILSVEIAKRTQDGLDYEYTKIGEITFDEPSSNLTSGQFSTVVDFRLTSFDTSIEKIIFRSVDNTDENIFIFPDPNLPFNVRQQPSPYFWANID